ncbi:MAG: DNA replication complex subunit Gins51 [Candidatus Kariarchaeaceae archaeon]|jgi:DNA replication initiation complex subunit (GINS family)
MSIYDQVLNAWKRERRNTDLLELDPEFYSKCREYVHHLESQVQNDEDQLMSKLFHKRWTRVNYIINDFLTIRMQKQIRDILSGTDFPKELPIEEAEIGKKLQKQLASFRDRVLGIEKHEEYHNDDELDQEGYAVVLFTQNENYETVGSDLNTYGPFEKGDIAIIPNVSMRNYQMRSKVEQIDIDFSKD